MKNRVSLTRQHFTLVELLVVIAVISILADLLLPTLSSSLEQARKATCTNNLKQIGLGLVLYTDDYSGYLPLHDWPGTSYLTKFIGTYMSSPDYTPQPTGVFWCPTTSSPIKYDGTSLAGLAKYITSYGSTGPDGYLANSTRLNGAYWGWDNIGGSGAWVQIKREKLNSRVVLLANQEYQTGFGDWVGAFERIWAGDGLNLSAPKYHVSFNHNFSDNFLLAGMSVESYNFGVKTVGNGTKSWILE